jgi:dTDP-4-dehydrorhamnose reductase
MIVILGGSGYVGTAFRRALEAAGLEYASVSRQRCNYYDPAALDDLLWHLHPRFTTVHLPLDNRATFVL